MSNEFLEVGEKGALICDDGPLAETLRQTLESIGFRCHTAETADQAIERITYTNYDVISVAEELAGCNLKTNAVLRHLALLPMAQRRFCYTLLVGNSFRTLDAMQAYAQSVHLVLNPADAANLGAILKRGLADFERLYATYHETLREAGELAYDRRRR